MDFKLLGGILLIIGTSIGAGMLALPIVTAQLGFIGSVILLIFSWSLMTVSSLLLLEVNLWLPLNSNLISMAKATIGPLGQILAWMTYLLLLYSLLCAYIAGGGDIFHALLLQQGMNFSLSSGAIIFTLLLGWVVFLGIRMVDYTNRGLMLVKFGAYLLMILMLLPLITTGKLASGHVMHVSLANALMVTITSFGYAAIIPSLRVYFGGDLKKLKKAIIVGSLVPLISYIAWDAAILGIVPIDGLTQIIRSNSQTSDLVHLLNSHVTQGTIPLLVKLFTSICMVTSFLGVGLCLADFLADGLQLEKKGKNNLFIHILTFFPPLIIVVFFPSVFVKALEYAGIYCVILLVLLPTWMVWQGRYNKAISKGYRAIGNKPLLVGLITFSVLSIIWACVT